MYEGVFIARSGNQLSLLLGKDKVGQSTRLVLLFYLRMNNYLYLELNENNCHPSKNVHFSLIFATNLYNQTTKLIMKVCKNSQVDFFNYQLK